MPEIQMPKLSDTMTEGTVVAWKKKKGEKVSTGDVIAEIETDKATMEWESPEDGVLTEIYVEEGGKVEVGQKIAFIAAAGETAPAAEAKAPTDKSKEAPPPKKQAETEQPAPAKGQQPETAPPQPAKKEAATQPAAKAESKPKAKRPSDEGRVKASPLARRLAAEEGLDISQIKGSGPERRVTETDVRAAMKSKPAASSAPQKKAPAPAKPAEGARILLSGMRKVIAGLKPSDNGRFLGHQGEELPW